MLKEWKSFMPKIFIKHQNKEIEFTPGENLLEILLENEIFVDNPCNGKGSCGKCKVRLLEGNLSAISETEGKFLKIYEVDSGVRLSCLVLPEEDITIELLQKERKHEVLTAGYMPDFEFKPSIPDDATDHVYGVAVDIGTTTLVTSLVDMKTGAEIAIASMINPQKKFGLDVLTRITYEIENPTDSIEKLQHTIVNALNVMIGEMCLEAEIERKNIYEISVAANCTMLHFLLGIDATPIGISPYTPAFVKSKNILASEIGLKAFADARLYCLPSVSAYIGADIVAGAYVCELQKAKENILFIDIGTNGEIVLSNHGKLLSCSCAAGPALEGMNISSGMRAAEGAIEDVKITESGIEFKVIGDEEPIGLCGSGILAVVKELIGKGFVKKNGTFIKKESLEESDYRYDMIRVDDKRREFVLKNSPGQILITQADVRQVQLAKGAILSGFYALLKQANIDMSELDKVLIAGQFGAHLPAESLVGTGILPEEVKDKLVYVGNASKTGAYMALMSVDVKEQIEELANKMDYMELGATEGYEKLFAQCLLF